MVFWKGYCIVCLKASQQVLFKLADQLRRFYTLIHIAVLISALAGFSLVGGLLFQLIEAPPEARAINLISISRRTVLENFHTELTTKKDPSQQNFDYHLNLYEMEFIAAIRNGTSIKNGKATALWSFPGSTYFCVTTFTQLGFGNLAPKSTLGKVITMIYACFGIPVGAVVFADLGRRLDILITNTWISMRRNLKQWREEANKITEDRTNVNYNAKKENENHLRGGRLNRVIRNWKQRRELPSSGQPGMGSHDEPFFLRRRGQRSTMRELDMLRLAMSSPFARSFPLLTASVLIRRLLCLFVARLCRRTQRGFARRTSKLPTFNHDNDEIDEDNTKNDIKMDEDNTKNDNEMDEDNTKNDNEMDEDNTKNDDEMDEDRTENDDKVDDDRIKNNEEVDDDRTNNNEEDDDDNTKNNDKVDDDNTRNNDKVDDDNTKNNDKIDDDRTENDDEINDVNTITTRWQIVLWDAAHHPPRHHDDANNNNEDKDSSSMVTVKIPGDVTGHGSRSGASSVGESLYRSSEGARNYARYSEEGFDIYGDTDEEDRTSMSEAAGIIMMTTVMLMVYIIIGAYMLTGQESWSYFESIWFLFISITTVGYGDVTPSSSKFLAFFVPYLILGMSIFGNFLGLAIFFLNNLTGRFRFIGRSYFDMYSAKTQTGSIQMKSRRARRWWRVLRQHVERGLPDNLVEESRQFKLKLFGTEREFIKEAFRIYFKRVYEDKLKLKLAKHRIARKKLMKKLQQANARTFPSPIMALVSAPAKKGKAAADDTSSPKVKSCWSRLCQRLRTIFCPGYGQWLVRMCTWLRSNRKKAPVANK